MPCASRVARGVHATPALAVVPLPLSPAQLLFHSLPCAHNQVCRLINDGYIQPASASAALECQICGDVRLLHRVQADASVEQV